MLVSDPADVQSSRTIWLIGSLMFQLRGRGTGELTTSPGSVKRREALTSTEKAKGPQVTGASAVQMNPTMPLHRPTSAMVRRNAEPPSCFHTSNSNVGIWSCDVVTMSTSVFVQFPEK